MLLNPRLLTPGPTPIPDRVRLAMAHPMIHHRKPEFKNIMAEMQVYLKQLFGTEQEVLPLACSGTGAMTAAVTNLFARGEKVLVAQAGKFGERWIEIAKSQELEIVELKKIWGEAISASDIETALNKDKDIKGVLIQISETSTGVMHPIHDIAKVTRSRDVLLVADGISSVGISPAPMDEWGIDALVTGSQKGLMVPTGLALLAFSERAWKKAEKVGHSCFYFNMIAERNNVRKNQTNFSSAVSLIIGLKEALSMIFEDKDGLCGLYQKQWAMTQMARTGISAMGLKPFAKEHYAWGLTSVRMPEHIKAGELVAEAAERTGVIMAAGQAPMKDEVLRIGHMGWVDWADIAAGLHSVDLCIKDKPTGYQDNYLNVALHAWHNASAYPKTAIM